MEKKQIYFISSLILAIIITIFAVANSGPVKVSLLFFKFEASQALVIFISAMIGAITVFLLNVIKQVELNKQIKTLKKENEDLLSQINKNSTPNE